ncbi:MAG: hypothetical protein WBQ77_03105, partial [Methyloceanibacter sp.]|uniref:hypothetical protein n=1 Tax=Methyloceanibacter sp. TaxID=1965321 RepID=UPI003C60F2E0
GEFPLGKDVEHLAPDIAGRADDGDFVTHSILLPVTAVWSTNCLLGRMPGSRRTVRRFDLPRGGCMGRCRQSKGALVFEGRTA